MFKLGISISNDAFGQTRFEAGREVARLLRQVADKAEAEGLDAAVAVATLIDVNGNRCGFIQYDSDGWPLPRHISVERALQQLATEARKSERTDLLEIILPALSDMHR